MALDSAYKLANKLWMVTEWIDGGTLKEALAVRPFSETEIQFVTREMLTGLDVLHRRNVVHRDIKPSNVMLTRTGRVVIIDFGLCAEVVDGTLSRMVGSPFFVAPEMVQRQPYSFPVDVWSLGITVLQLCNRRLPYGLDPVRSMFMYAAVGVPDPWDAGHQWSAQLRDAVERTLRVDPAQRATVRDLLQHAVFRNRDWMRPPAMEAVQQGLAALWPAGLAADAPPVAGEVTQSEAEIATGLPRAPRLANPTGQLLDEDVPRFETAALPTMDDVD